MNGTDEDVRTMLVTGSSDMPPGIDLLSGLRERQAPARRQARYRMRALISAGAVAAAVGGTVLATTLTATVASAPPALAAVTAAAAKTSAEGFHVTIKAVTTEPVPRGRGATSVLPWGITGEYDPPRGIGEETITQPRTPTTQVIYVGRQMYVHTDAPQTKNPPASGPGPVTKPWIELAIWPRLSATAIAVSPDFGQQQSADPGALLGFLKSVGTVTDQGPTSGPHWTGTKYGFTVTAPKHTASASGTIDVDSQGQVRRMLVTLTFAAGGGVNFTCREDVTYSNFGDPVTVTVPPASQVDRFSGNGMIGLIPW